MKRVVGVEKSLLAVSLIRRVLLKSDADKLAADCGNLIKAVSILDLMTAEASRCNFLDVVCVKELLRSWMTALIKILRMLREGLLRTGVSKSVMLLICAPG
jgi:hypothetical protein